MHEWYAARTRSWTRQAGQRSPGGLRSPRVSLRPGVRLRGRLLASERPFNDLPGRDVLEVVNLDALAGGGDRGRSTAHLHPVFRTASVLAGDSLRLGERCARSDRLVQTFELAVARGLEKRLFLLVARLHIAERLRRNGSGASGPRVEALAQTI